MTGKPQNNCGVINSETVLLHNEVKLDPSAAPFPKGAPSPCSPPSTAHVRPLPC